MRTIAIYNCFVLLLFVIQTLPSTGGHQLPLVAFTSACLYFYFTVHNIPYFHSFHIFYSVLLCQSGKCYLLNYVFEFYLPSLLNIYPLCYHVKYFLACYHCVAVSCEKETFHREGKVIKTTGCSEERRDISFFGKTP